MSISAVITIQMKITHAKKMSVVHRMSRNGYDEAMNNLTPIYGERSGCPAPRGHARLSWMQA